MTIGGLQSNHARATAVLAQVNADVGTSHVTRHTSHVTRHTSHFTRHTSHVTPQRLNLSCIVILRVKDDQVPDAAAATLAEALGLEGNVCCAMHVAQSVESVCYSNPQNATQCIASVALLIVDLRSSSIAWQMPKLSLCLCRFTVAWGLLLSLLTFTRNFPAKTRYR